MEKRIGYIEEISLMLKKDGLNPYCSGKKNRIKQTMFMESCWRSVLILIVVEKRIGYCIKDSSRAADESLNPYCSGKKNRILASNSIMLLGI